MNDEAKIGPGRLVLGALGGAAVGGLATLSGHLLLHEAGLARPDVAGRLQLAGPAVAAWLVLLGALLGAFGRRALGAVERALLPPGLEPGAVLLYRLAGLAALLAVAHYSVASFVLRDPVDLPTFLLAARAIAAGADPYDPVALAGFAGRALPGGQALPYLYLPLFAVLLRPLAVLPLPTAYAAVLVGNALLWPLLLYLSFRLVAPRAEVRGPLLAVGLLLTASFLPAIQTLHHGSPSLLVAVLVVGTLVLERDGRSRAAGLLLALAILVKVVPVLVLAYFLVRRRWAAVAWTAAAGAGLLAVSLAGAGLELHLRWLSEVAPGLASGARTGTWFEPACHPENQALTGLVCRLLGEPRRDLLRPVVLLLSAGVVGLAAAAMVRRRRGRLGGADASLLVVTMLLASTITWFHHMTLMLPVVLALLAEAASLRGWRRSLLGGLGLAVLVTVGFEFLLDPWPFVVPHVVGRSVRFLAMVLAYGALVSLAFAARAERGGGEGVGGAGAT